MILPVFLYGQPVLRKEAEDVPKDYPDLKQLVANMFETMYNADGVGLAAPQVGLSIRLVVIDGDVMGDDFPECKGFKRALINPEFLERSEEEIAMEEGCLSLPGIHEKVSRSKTVRVRYWDENWEEHEEVVEGFAARIVQHECEHLTGHVFIDNVSAIRRQLNKGKLNSIIKGLQAYQDALKAGIQEYKKKIISDIEPLLHIYTAKILQQKFNGKSIYIHSSENVQDIQFVNSAQDNQDILYSMSSGQLSAVALSFLLCMNQAYGADKACSILLIDDPVQTIDDVNMVGFVDILRYEFGDRQIFISTHEQSFEWFLRYRYSKAEKKVNVFNMKDIMLQE